MKKIYLFSLLSIFLGGCTVYPATGNYVGYSNYYTPTPNITSTITVRPYYPMPVPGCIWKFSPILGWGWYRSDYGWYIHGEGWRHEHEENEHPYYQGYGENHYEFHQHGMEHGRNEEDSRRYGRDD